MNCAGDLLERGHHNILIELGIDAFPGKPSILEGSFPCHVQVDDVRAPQPEVCAEGLPHTIALTFDRHANDSSTRAGRINN